MLRNERGYALSPPGAMSSPASTLTPMADARRVVGSLGEQAAASAFEADGYRILDRNFRVRAGEIDLVCEKDGTIVFCEVKTRTSATYGLPEEAVTWSKQRRLRRLAVEYLHRSGRRARSVRFDVVAVTVADGRVTGLRHIADAFA